MTNTQDTQKVSKRWNIAGIVCLVFAVVCLILAFLTKDGAWWGLTAIFVFIGFGFLNIKRLKSKK